MNRRLPALAVIVAVLATLVALGASADDRPPEPFGRARADGQPRADPGAALSSTWYCAAGMAEKNGLANLTVVIANIGEEARKGSVVLMPSGGGSRKAVPVTVPASGRVEVAARDHLDAPVVSALVELDGGRVAVEHIVEGPLGDGVAPCASQPSDRWYLANGVTERDARQALALFNPFPDDAVVDISVSTDEGRAEPPKLQGLPLPPGTTTMVPLQDFVRRRAVTSVSIVARTGRLVVDRLQWFAGGAGRTGLSLALAAPAPATTWSFPEGFFGDGMAETWHVYNPGDDEAEATLELTPADGDPPEPFDFTVPAHSQQTIDAGTIKRVAAGVGHAATIRSLNGVPLVAERAFDARRPPAARRGWSSSLGSPGAARSWVSPVGAAPRTDEWIVVQNPGSRRLRVSVSALTGGRRVAVEGLQRLALGPAGRLAVRLGDHFDGGAVPIVVEATGDVVVERGLYATGSTGLSTTIAIPTR